MAKGDVINGASSQGTTTTYTFQPAAGVEIILTAVGTDSGANDMDASITNGTIEWYFVRDQQYLSAKTLIGITNTSYLNLNQGNAGTKTVGFSGVQVK